jgi:hypothetical protein
MSEPHFDNSALRVVIKDIDVYGKIEDVASGAISVVIDTPDAINALESADMINAWKAKHDQQQQNDPDAVREKARISEQVVSKKDTVFFKVYNLNLKQGAPLDIAIFKKSSLEFRASISPLLDDYSMKEIFFEDLQVKLQNNLKILIVGARRQIRRELENKLISSAKYNPTEEERAIEKLKRDCPISTLMEQDTKNTITNPYKDLHEMVAILVAEVKKAYKQWSGATLLKYYITYQNLKFKNSKTEFKTAAETQKHEEGIPNNLSQFMNQVDSLYGKVPKTQLKQNQPLMQRLFMLYHSVVKEGKDEDASLSSFMKLAEMGSFFAAEFKAEEINWFYDDFDSFLQRIFPNQSFKQAIFQGLHTDFVFDLFNYQPGRGGAGNRPTNLMIQKNLTYFIKSFCTNMRQFVIFMCKCFLSFESERNKLKTGTLRAAVAFLHHLIIELGGQQRLINTLDSDSELRVLYLVCLAKAATALDGVEVESAMEEDFEIQLKSNQKFDYSLFMIESFWESMVPARASSSAFLVLFQQPSISERATPNLLKHFFETSNFNTSEKQKGFTLIYCINSEISGNLQGFMNNILTEPGYLKQLPISDFLEYFSSFRPSEASNAFSIFLESPEITLLEENMMYHLLNSEIPEVKEYLERSNHYFPSLFKGMANYLKDMRNNVIIGHLANSKVFSDKKLQFFMMFIEKNPSITDKDFKALLTELGNQVVKELGTLEIVEKVMENNADFLKYFSFYERTWNELQLIKTQTLKTLTLNQLVSNPVFTTTKPLLNTSFWQKNSYLTSYNPFEELIKGKINKDMSMDQYFTLFTSEATSYKAKIAVFLDPTRFTLADYNKYFPRIAFKENSDTYWTFFHGLDFTEEEKEKLIKGCIIMHSVNKVIKIKDPMLNLMKILGTPLDEFGKNIEELANSLTPIPKEKLTLQQVKDLDTHKIIDVENLDESLLYRMPMLIKVIAISPDTLHFIKKTSNEQLKAMREEVDDENLDLMNMLDVVNKNLRFIVEENSITFKEIVQKTFLIHKFDQRRLKEFLKVVEPQIEKTIVFLAQKATKDSNYNKRIIHSMLQNSEIIIRHDNKAKKFIVEVYYDEKGKLVLLKPFEFDELLNKAKIIAAESTSNDAEANRDFTYAMQSFSKFGSQLEAISNVFGNLRTLGVIHSRIKDLIPFMNKACSVKDYFIEKEEGTQIFFKYTGSNGKTENLNDLIATNNSLKKLFQKLSKDLEESYIGETYLMTLFQGKRLYYLIELLRGNFNFDDIEGSQVKQMVTSFVPEELVDFSIVHPMETTDIDPSTIIMDVRANLKVWSKNIKYGDTVVEPQTKVFTSKKIKLSTTSGNYYKTMLKILCNAKQPMCRLSHLLLCTRMTSDGEILSFCRRAMLDPFKKIYFVLGAERLQFEQIVFMKKTLLELYNSRNALNKNLLIFTSKSNLFESDEFEVIDSLLHTLESKEVPDQMLLTSFSSLSTTNIVISDQAGMGKTTYICEKWANQGELLNIFFSGELSKNSVKHRLNNLASVIYGFQESFGIIVQLDYIEDFDTNYANLDYLIFCICLARCFFTESGCFFFDKRMQGSFLEISNSFKLELLSTLDFIKLFTDMQVEGGKPPGICYVENFSFDRLHFITFEDSDSYTVGRFLAELDQSSKNTEEEIIKKRTITEDQFRSLVKTYFLKDYLGGKKTEEERLQTTYSQYSFWLKTLASLARGMNQVENLQISNLKKNDDDEDEADSDLLKLKDTRKQIMMELLQFCTYIINVSVSQAKSSQDEMKKMMIEIKSDKNKLSEIMSKYADKFTNIIPWNSNSLIVPLFKNGKAFFAMKRFENIFNNPKILDVYEVENKQSNTQPPNLRSGNRKEMRNYVKNSKMFINFDKGAPDPSIQCMELFAKFYGENDADLKKRAAEFKGGKGFVFTFENFMKISLITLKADLRIPIVMMGESGCGKTYLTQFISECLLQDEMKELTLYSGVTEKDFIKFMYECVATANELGGHRKLWVFFDEFNTSPLQSLVAEIMIDRICSIEPNIDVVPKNIVFIGCCNPFRMKTKKTEVGLVPKTSDTILSHRVYPIPERLLNYVWDFGQLSKADEMKHIESMVKAENIFTEAEATRRGKFINLAYSSHATVREIEERSGVSLRDVKRVLKLYAWFKKIIEQLDIFKGEEWIRAAICSVYTAYGLRLNGRDSDQEKLLNSITEVVKSETSKGIKKSDVMETLPYLAQIYLDILKKVTNSIPDNIAINRPLKENFITMLACYDARIPLIICGAPGTSKTLCSQIFDSALITSLIRSEKVFSSFKAINSMYYGGSQTSTADGISKVFNRAQHYLDQGGEDTPVVVFDEIGLAELSPYNPLKVLHPLLEKPNQEVGFFGISNWTLDLSKMNRLIYLARPDMGLKDLTEIFDISVKACNEATGQSSEIPKLLKSNLDSLAKAYLEFRLWQKRNGETHMIHPNFHGSRDIYGVSRFLYNSVAKGKFKSEKEIPALIKNAIERNFNGAVYQFGQEQGSLPLDLVPGIADKASTSGSFSSIRLQDIGSPYDATRKEIPKNLIIFSSSQVFKQIFLNTIKQHASLFGSDFFFETPVLEQVTANILDLNARFLLIKSEGEVVDNLFMELLKTIMAYRDKNIPIKDWRGIKGKENSIELLTTLKNYISLGYIVVMKNLDDLYGSLYDLFNQKYTEVEGRLYCYLYFGENKHKVEVHPNFKTIILLEAEKEMKGRELELEQPAPFLNRFEKFFVRMSNLLPEEDMKFIYDLVGYLHSLIGGKPFRILGMSIDMIASIHKKARQEGGMDPNKVKEHINRLIYRMATTHFLLRTNLTDTDLQIFAEEHPYENLNKAIESFKKMGYIKTCIYTMSNPIELEHYTKKWFDDKNPSSVFFTSEQLLRLGLEARAEKLKNLSADLLLVQFTQKDHFDLISQLKSTINENKNIKRTIFLIHVDRRAIDAAKINGNIGLNYWDDWDNYVIEDIGGVAYKELANLYSLSIKEMFFSKMGLDNYTSLKVLKEASVIILQRIIMESNDITLTKNFQYIKDMFVNDRVFVYHMVQKLMPIVDTSKSWRSLIVQKLGSNINYTDIDSALLSVLCDPKNGIGDLMKKFMLKVNERLTNLASYAIHYNDDNEKVRDTYQNNFEEKLKGNFTRGDILSAVYTKGHYRVPFLAPSYIRFFDRFSGDLVANYKDEYLKLSETYKIYWNSKNMAKGKGDDSPAKGIQEKLVNLESFILKSFNNLLIDLFESSEEIAEMVKTEETLREELITDLVFGMLLTLDSLNKASTREKSSEDFSNHLQNKFGYFLELCKGLLEISESDENYTNDLLTMSSILCISFFSDFKYLLYLVGITNVGLEQFKQMIKSIRSGLSDRTKGKYGLIHGLKLELQKSSLPDFSDPHLDLKKQKNIYADLVNQATSGSEANIDFDLHYMAILLELLDNFPKDLVEKIKKELSEESKAKMSYGGQFVLDLAKDFLKKYILEIPKITLTEKQIEAVSLVVSEYINSCAYKMDFTPFMSPDMNPVFEALDRQVTAVSTPRDSQRGRTSEGAGIFYSERIASSLAHVISKKINAPVDLDSMIDELKRIETDEDLKIISEMLQSENKMERLELLSIFLVDSIHFNSLQKLEGAALPDKIKILGHLMDESKDPNYSSLANLLEYSMTRLLFSSGTMEQMLSDKKFRESFEKYMYFDTNDLWEFLKDPNNLPMVYFLQEIILRDGNLHEYGQKIKAVADLDELFNTVDPGHFIVFLNGDYQEKLKYITVAINKVEHNPNVASAIDVELKTFFENIVSKYKDYVAWYIYGCALINKFYTYSDREKPSEELIALREFCKKLLLYLPSNAMVINVLEGIIYSMPFVLSDSLILKGQNISDSYDEKRLKKVMYQFMLMVACFGKSSGYDPAVWRSWAKGDIANEYLKLPVPYSTEIVNMASVFENIIVERLVDGDYLFYKNNAQYTHLLENLGVYKCSCGFMYSIGNCGYAMVEIPCPSCGKPIGGYSHKLIERAGHEQIVSLSQFSDLIRAKYDLVKGKYTLHLVVKKSTPELLPVKLAELRDLDSVRAYLCGAETEDGLDRYDAKLQMRHLWDHMFLFSLPYFIGNDSDKLKEGLEKYYEHQMDPSNNTGEDAQYRLASLKRMADQRIENFTGYLLAHIRNDMVCLNEFLGFKNSYSILIYMRGVLSIIGERLMDGNNMTTQNETLLDYNELKNPPKLIAKQIRSARQEYGNISGKGAVKGGLTDDQKLFKAIVMRNSTTETLREEISESERERYVLLTYKIMRHIDLTPDNVMKLFKEKLNMSTQVSLLKYLSKYEDLLRDFQDILDVNIRIAMHFNLNYDRAFSLADVNSKQIKELFEDDKDPTLANLYEEFKRVWRDLVPTHERAHPKVFSFAFQCQQDLDIKGYIDSIVEFDDAPLMKFMFMRKDEGLGFLVAIVQTFIKFHNELVEKISIALNLESSNFADKKSSKGVEYCTKEDYVGYYDFMSHLWDNFWFETTPGKESEVHFDLGRIQYLCARNMKKQLINFEEDNIVYYNLRGFDQNALLQTCQKLINKMTPRELDKGKINDIKNSWSEDKLAKSMQFIVEVGDYAFTNFMFNVPDKKLKEIVEDRTDGGVQRFNTYEPSLHADLMLGQLGQILRAHREGLLLCDITENKSEYEQPFTEAQQSQFKPFLDRQNVTVSDLLKISECYTVAMIEYHRKAKSLKDSRVSKANSAEQRAIAEADYLEGLEKTFEEETDIKFTGLDFDMPESELGNEEINLLVSFRLNQYLRLKNRIQLSIIEKERRG